MTLLLESTVSKIQYLPMSALVSVKFVGSDAGLARLSLWNRNANCGLPCGPGGPCNTGTVKTP